MGQFPRQSRITGTSGGELQVPDRTSTGTNAAHGGHPSEEGLEVREEKRVKTGEPIGGDRSLPHQKRVRMLLLGEEADGVGAHTLVTSGC